MHHKKLAQILWFSYDLQVNHRVRVPLFLWGLAGQGKTTAVYELADRLAAETKKDVRITVLHLATQDVGDLIGMPVRDEENKKTIWYMPEWFPTVDDENVINLVFLDEFNRAPKYVLAAMLPFLLEGRMHQHIAPSNTFIVAAGNPPSDEYDVTQLFDEALISRLGHIILEVDHKEWLERHTFRDDNRPDFAVDECVWEVVNKEPQVLRNGTLDMDGLGFKIRPNPRTLHLVGRITKTMNKTQFKVFGYELVKAFVGEECAQLIKKEKEKQLESVDVEALLNDYDKVRGQIKRLSDPKNARTDLIQATNNRLIQAIIQQKLACQEDASEEEKSKGVNVMHYLLQIPKDQARAMLGLLVSHENKICENLVTFMGSGHPIGDQLYKMMEATIEDKDEEKKTKNKGSKKATKSKTK